MASDAKDPIVKWLVRAADGRVAFDVTNLLAASLHREVLKGGQEVANLAAFYPTVNEGSATAALFIGDPKETKEVSPHFVSALREAILARQDALQLFVQTYNVQTNETGRGIAWLLPVSLTGWDGIHLVDIGASAGLNLVSEQRAYRLIDEVGNKKVLDLGAGDLQQFVIRTTGEGGNELAGDLQIPRILSRTGCDLHPFQLRTAVDEQTLSSFVWGDQFERLQRLREGIAAFHNINRSSVPVRLHAVRLPEELPLFLDQRIAMSQDPVVIYNTYIKMYLPDKGVAVRTHISRWAQEQERPVMWIQWEPPKFVVVDTGDEPEYGWLAWALDYWHEGKHKQQQIGWVHPHGQRLQWLPGFKQWINYWRNSSNNRTDAVIEQ